MKKILLSLLILFLEISQGYASYVITNAQLNGFNYVNSDVYVSATGSGTQDGSSPANAWAGFSAVQWGFGQGQAGPHYNLYVCGTIRQALSIPISGLDTNHPLIIRGDCPGNPGIIDGANPVTGSWTLVSSNVYSIPLTMPLNPGQYGIVTEDDNALVAIAWNTDAPTTIAAMVAYGNGTWSYDSVNQILYVLASGADNPTSHVMESSFGQHFSELVSAFGFSFITLENITIKNSGDYGVDFNTGANDTINNCLIYNTSNWGIFTNAITTITATNNTLHNVVWVSHLPVSAFAGEAMRFNDDTGGTISGNDVSENPSPGIDLVSGTTGVSVFQNVVHDNIGLNMQFSNGIYSDNSSNNFIYRNKIFNYMSGMSLNGEAPSSFTSGTYVYNNLIYNCYYSGMYVGGTAGWTSSENNFIYNNTFYVGSNADPSGSQAIAIQGSVNDTIQNNIFWGNVYTNASGGFQTFTPGFVDYNQYLTTSFTGSYTSFAAFQTANGGDTHSGNYPSSPNVFVNAPGGELQLLPGSTPVNAGKNLYSIFTNDYFNNPRPSSGPWDVGGYQNV